MNLVTRPLSSKERQELLGIISVWTALGRALLFCALFVVAGVIARSINKLTPTVSWWPVVTVLFGIYLYRAARVLTGGHELRRLVKMDIVYGFVEDYSFAVRSAIVFPEVEDEGPVWCFGQDGKTWCISGQRLPLLTRDGLPRSSIVVSMTPNAKRLMRIKVSGLSIEVSRSKQSFVDLPPAYAFKLTSPVLELPVAWEEFSQNVIKAETEGPNSAHLNS